LQPAGYCSTGTAARRPPEALYLRPAVSIAPLSRYSGRFTSLDPVRAVADPLFLRLCL